ncbi:hypothetical protein BKA80DRAFT_87267 [Phyllosticta citrichinensis]
MPSRLARHQVCHRPILDHSRLFFFLPYFVHSLPLISSFACSRWSQPTNSRFRRLLLRCSALHCNTTKRAIFACLVLDNVFSDLRVKSHDCSQVSIHTEHDCIPYLSFGNHEWVLCFPVQVTSNIYVSARLFATDQFPIFTRLHVLAFELADGSSQQARRYRYVKAKKLSGSPPLWPRRQIVLNVL